RFFTNIPVRGEDQQQSRRGQSPAPPHDLPDSRLCSDLGKHLMPDHRHRIVRERLERRRIRTHFFRQFPASRAGRQMLVDVLIRVLIEPQCDFAFMPGHLRSFTYFASFTRATEIWLLTVTSSTPRITATSRVERP